MMEAKLIFLAFAVCALIALFNSACDLREGERYRREMRERHERECKSRKPGDPPVPPPPIDC